MPEDTTSVVEPTSVETKVVTQASDSQKEIDRLTKVAQDASKEAAKYRTELKAREEIDLAAKGELSELNKNLQKDRDEITAKHEASEAARIAAETKLTAIETARKLELLNKIPENIRGEYADMNLDVLEKVSKHLAVTTVNNSLGSDRGAGALNGKPEAYTPQIPFESGSQKTISMINNILKGQ